MVEFKNNKISRRIYGCFPYMKFGKTKDGFKDMKETKYSLPTDIDPQLSYRLHVQSQEI